MMDIQRSMLWAMSARDSRSPRGDCVWSTKMALPPRVLMAVSKVRRVRREAFSKNMTIWRASRAWRKSSGLALTAWASSMMAAISWTVRSAMEQRSRPQRRLEASLKAVSDWMPRVACVRGKSSTMSGFGFMMTVLLPIGFFSCRRCAGIGCTEDLIECFDGGLDVLALEKEGWEETEDGVAGAVDDDAALHHLGGDALGEIGGVEFDAEHEAFAAYVDDAVVAFGELRELLVEEG